MRTAIELEVVNKTECDFGCDFKTYTGDLSDKPSCYVISKKWFLVDEKQREG